MMYKQTKRVRQIFFKYMAGQKLMSWNLRRRLLTV
jgi:hypothetical protein